MFAIMETAHGKLDLRAGLYASDEAFLGKSGWQTTSMTAPESQRNLHQGADQNSDGRDHGARIGSICMD